MIEDVGLEEQLSSLGSIMALKRGFLRLRPAVATIPPVSVFPMTSPIGKIDNLAKQPTPSC